MADKNIKSKIVGGLVWVFGERVLAQLVSMFVAIVLARLLTPEHYGMISIVTVFITFLNVFITSGFGSALVQKKNTDTLDFNTAFLLSFGLSIVLYFVLFFIAPVIANFYEVQLLNSVLRVMGLQLPIAAIGNIQRAYIQKEMSFKKFFWVTLGSTVISGFFGIVVAYSGLGVWTLVVQYLSNTAIGTILLFFVCNWRPQLQCSLDRAKDIWNFGWKILATQIISTIEGDLRSLVVGKMFGSSDLAYYDQGRKYPSLLVTSISASIDSVMLSAYSKEQDNKDRVLSMLRRSIRTGVYILVPILLGFAAVSESFVSLALTDKWLPIVPYIQVFCLSFLTRPLESSCRQALLAIGKSGSVLLIITIINIVALIGTMIAVFVFESVFAIALLSLIITVVSFLGFMCFSRCFLNYKFQMLVQDVLPSLIIGFTMYVIVVTIGKLLEIGFVSLLIQILLGVAVYIFCSWIFRVESLYSLLKTIRKK